MKSKIYAVIILTVILIIYIGCSKDVPKCSDNETIKLARQSILSHVGSTLLSEKEFQEDIKIENPFASALDEKIKRYSCGAKLVFKYKEELPITYYSQLNDHNKHIVYLDNTSLKLIVQQITSNNCAKANSDIKAAFVAAQAIYNKNRKANISTIEQLEKHGFEKTERVDITILSGRFNDLKIRSKHSGCEKTYYLDSYGIISSSYY